MLTILFDGIAYGMLLFVLACGLAVTLGLMNFVNLAHGAFAMAGGYVTAVLMNRYGVPFLLTLPLAFAVPAVIGLVLERTLYKQLYARSHLDQVLFSIGLVFMAVAAVDYTMGSQQQMIQIPTWLQGRVEILRRPGRPLPQLHHRRLRRSRGRAAIHSDANPLRQPVAGRGGRSAGRPRSRHQCQRDLRRHLRGRFRARGTGRRAGSGDPGPRSHVPAQVHDLLSDRRHGRRHHQHHRPVSRPPSFSGSPMSPASTTCRAWVPSSSTRS